jgi:hypothetical protein
MYGPRLIDSAPPPMATSASPSITDCAAETMAFKPLPHSRLTFIAGTSCGRPPSIAATRDRYMIGRPADGGLMQIGRRMMGVNPPQVSPADAPIAVLEPRFAAACGPPSWPRLRTVPGTTRRRAPARPWATRSSR